MQELKQEVTKVVFFVKMMENILSRVEGKTVITQTYF